jgi:hypothetical protein
MVDEWNSKAFSIEGTISSVDIVQFENQKVTTLEKVNLDEK